MTENRNAPNFYLLHILFEKESVVVFSIFPLTSSGMGKKPDFIVKIWIYYKTRLFPISDEVMGCMQKITTVLAPIKVALKYWPI